MTPLKENFIMLVNSISDKSFENLYPVLVDCIRKQFFGDNPPIIETDLTEEELAIIEAGIKEYEENPASFTPLDIVLEEGYNID